MKSKILLLTAAAMLGFSGLPNAPVVLADDLCSMTTSSGKVVDLGSLCGKSGATTTQPKPSQPAINTKFTGKCPIISAKLVYSKIQANNEECYYVRIGDVKIVGKAGDNIFTVPVAKSLVEVSSTSAFSTGYDIYKVDCDSRRFTLTNRRKTDDRGRVIEDLKLANGWVKLTDSDSPEAGMYSYACKLAI